DERDLRQCPVENALRQGQERVLSALGVVPAFQRRSRRSHQDRDVLEPGSHHGDVARMIARRRLLLECRLVFLVNHAEAEFGCRGEDGAAGADDDLNMSRRDAPPVSAALGIPKMTMKDSNLATSTAKALDRLRRQTDFRHEYECFLALLNDF